METTESISSSAIKIELPIFTGEDPQGWLSEIQSYFTINDIDDEDRFMLAGHCMDGVAFEWFQWLWMVFGTLSWSDFQGFLIARFKPPPEINPSESELQIEFSYPLEEETVQAVDLRVEDAEKGVTVDEAILPRGFVGGRKKIGKGGKRGRLRRQRTQRAETIPCLNSLCSLKLQDSKKRTRQRMLVRKKKENRKRAKQKKKKMRTSNWLGICCHPIGGKLNHPNSRPPTLRLPTSPVDNSSDQFPVANRLPNILKHMRRHIPAYHRPWSWRVRKKGQGEQKVVGNRRQHRFRNSSLSDRIAYGVNKEFRRIFTLDGVLFVKAGARSRGGKMERSVRVASVSRQTVANADTVLEKLDSKLKEICEPTPDAANFSQPLEKAVALGEMEVAKSLKELHEVEGKRAKKAEVDKIQSATDESAAAFIKELEQKAIAVKVGKRQVQETQLNFRSIYKMMVILHLDLPWQISL